MVLKSINVPLGFRFGVCLASDKKHVGIAYREADDLKILHLAWHHFLLNEPIHLRGNSYFCSEMDLEPELLQFLQVQASLFTHVDHAPIPYAIKLPVIVFDSTDNYRFKGCKPGEGLTCATFVMKFLQAFGFDIIDEISWQKRDTDIQFADQILTQLEKYLVEHGHQTGHSTELKHVEEAKNLAREAVRFRPIEVFCSGIQPHSSHPIQFKDIDLLVAEIEELLSKAS